MRRLIVGAALVLALAGCSSPPAPAPSPSVASMTAMDKVEILGGLRAKLCTANEPEPWQECTTKASQYLGLALQIHDEMVDAGTATPDMADTVQLMTVLRTRCTPAELSVESTRDCRYSFDTVRDTGKTFQDQIKVTAGS